MQNNYITLTGKIEFDPVNKTKKHLSQSEWKHVAMIRFDCDISDYYAWFLSKRFNLTLNKPIRGGHITFINDNHSDIDAETDDEAHWKWLKLKQKYDGTSIEVTLDVNPRTNSTYWWINIPEEHRKVIHGIREECGLGRPYFGLHLTLGYATNLNLEHSTYIHEMIKKDFIL